MSGAPSCPRCGAETLPSTEPGAVYCPHCGGNVWPGAASIAEDPTIPIPIDLVRAKFATDSTMPPPPLESAELDEPEPPSVPTRPETPASKAKSDPPDAK